MILILNNYKGEALHNVKDGWDKLLFHFNCLVTQPDGLAPPVKIPPLGTVRVLVRGKETYSVTF
jgi:hypothetical protein